MLVSMSTTTEPVTVAEGFCYLCGSGVDGDIREHVSQMHQRAVNKTATAIKSWRDRLDAVVEAIGEIRQESDIATQIQKPDDEVIKELYLVRARLTQTMRTTAATKG